MIHIIYVIPMLSRYRESARRFLETYEAFPPGSGHPLHLVLQQTANDDVPLSSMELGPIKATVHLNRDNNLWEFSAFGHVCRTLDPEASIFCLTTRSYFRRPDWMLPFSRAWEEYGPGLYGASASREVSPHIRTTGFLCSAGFYLQVLARNQNRNEMELGQHSLTDLALRKGLPVGLVTRKKTFPLTDCRTGDNLAMSGDQSNCLVYDHYDRSSWFLKKMIKLQVDGWWLPKKIFYGQHRLRQLCANIF